MLFDKEVKEKFERGAKEHGNGWDSVDPVKELKDELLDIYNYASHVKMEESADKTVMATRLKALARSMWVVLNDIQK